MHYVTSLSRALHSFPTRRSSDLSRLPRLTPEQRRAAAGQFERANQVLAKGDFDYALPLLLNCCVIDPGNPDRKSTRLNSSHLVISYAVFCLKKKNRK